MTRAVAASLASLLLARPVPAAVITLDERLVTNDANVDRDAKISNGTIAFVTERGGTRDVFALAPDGELEIAAGGPGAQNNIDLDGDLVAYVDDALGDLNIAVANLTTNTRAFITLDPNRDSDPAIDGSLVVFATWRSGTSDIFSYDLATAELGIVAGGPDDQLTPDVDGSLVAWTAFQNGTFDLLARVLGSAAFPVSAGDADEVAPSVSGERIAYLADRDVFVYDHALRSTVRVTDDAFDQNDVRIDGELVVWTDDRHGNYDVFLRDLTTGSTHRLTDDPSDQVLGDLEPGSVVFHDRRLGDFNVWQVEFALAPEADSDGVADAPDNCDRTTNASQADTGGLNSSTPDGVGNACQNGDWNGDGATDIVDVVIIRQHLAGSRTVDPRMPPEAQP